MEKNEHQITPTRCRGGVEKDTWRFAAAEARSVFHPEVLSSGWGLETGFDPLAARQTGYSLMEARGYGTAGIYIIGDWLDAIAENREPLGTGEDLVRALEVIVAIYAAARSGRRLQFPGG